MSEPTNGQQPAGNGASAPPMSAKRRTGMGWGPTYEEAAMGLPNYWYPVMFSVQLGKRPKPLTMLGQNLLFVRRNKKAYAVADRCPHRGIPLHQGKFEFEGTISCIYHGWTFDLATGQLVAALTDGPDSPMPGRPTTCIRSYPVEERAGMVWVWMGAGAPMVPVEEDIPGELLRDDLLMVGWFHQRYGNWRFGIENAIDESHARYLHRDSIQKLWTQPPAWTDVKILESSISRGLFRRQDWSQTYADYEGLGTWPKRRWWRKERNARAQRTSQKVTLAVMPEGRGARGGTKLPCHFGGGGAGWPYPMAVLYEFHVPVDRENELYGQLLCRFTKNPISRLIFRLKYALWHRWVGHWRFNSQDGSMVAAMTANTKTERLMKPDASITAWRKMVERQARGQVDQWRSIGVEHTADLELEFKGTGATKASGPVDPATVYSTES